MTSGPGYATRTVILRVRKNAKLVTPKGLAYIFVKMLARPHIKDLQKLRQHVGAFLDSPKDVFNQVYLPKNFTIECRYNHVSNIEKQ